MTGHEIPHRAHYLQFQIVNHETSVPSEIKHSL